MRDSIEKAVDKVLGEQRGSGWSKIVRELKDEAHEVAGLDIFPEFDRVARAAYSEVAEKLGLSRDRDAYVKGYEVFVRQVLSSLDSVARKGVSDTGAVFDRVYREED